MCTFLMPNGPSIFEKGHSHSGFCLRWIKIAFNTAAPSLNSQKGGCMWPVKTMSTIPSRAVVKRPAVNKVNCKSVPPPQPTLNSLREDEQSKSRYSRLMQLSVFSTAIVHIQQPNLPTIIVLVTNWRCYCYVNLFADLIFEREKIYERKCFFQQLLSTYNNRIYPQ